MRMSTLSRGVRRASSAATPLVKTALYDLLSSLGGKMVPFAGYSLPVQFGDGVLNSHLYARSAGGAVLFDVGHMGQIRWHGKDRAAFLERVIVADVAELKVRLQGFISVGRCKSRESPPFFYACAGLVTCG